MGGFLLIVALLAFVVYFFVRRMRKVDEKLQADRAVREAQMLAAAHAWRNSQKTIEGSKSPENP